LIQLEEVEQSPQYHPEGNALFHSLQVFQCALNATDQPALWAAALFHDIGKAMDYQHHDLVGAEELEGILKPHICWLVRHHLDLLKSPKKTRMKLKGRSELIDLEKLRKWDLQGRNPYAQVMEPSEAITILAPYSSSLLL